ncbi:MAG: Phosphatidylglycerol/phosphatidylinositol transfer protein [Bogoriella megaspora]|nr:MAG: Phosphatidylglycerol/phosphatidylinositol transfer protein [Bogoriella megaspora]
MKPPILPLVSSILCLSHAFAADRYLDNSDDLLPPGDTPFKYCNESRKKDILTIDSVQLLPRTIHIDDVFVVHIYGNFSKDVPENSTLTFHGHAGNGTGKTIDVDFCSVIDRIDQPDPGRKRQCPPEKGWALMTMSAWTHPLFFQPAHYYFRFDAKTPNGERIYCAEAEMDLDYKDDDRLVSQDGQSSRQQRLRPHRLKPN